MRSASISQSVVNLSCALDVFAPHLEYTMTAGTTPPDSVLICCEKLSSHERSLLQKETTMSIELTLAAVARGGVVCAHRAFAG